MDIEMLRARHAELDRLIKDGHSNYIADKNLQKMKYEKAYIRRKIQQHESSSNH